jgi:DNA-binding LytR/AlgR family response regulator
MKQILSCIVIEDEPIAQEIMLDYINQVSFLSFKNSFIDAVSASTYLKNNPVDLIFLDIHLPGIKGNEFIKLLNYSPQIIFTTAYSDYAIEAFELDVLDYLMKPISFSRFLKSVNKLKLPDHVEDNFETFNENKKIYKVYHDEIVYIESVRDYCKIHTMTNQAITTKTTISDLYEKLKSKGFRRIHRSYIVNESKIRMESPNQVQVHEIFLPKGRLFK